MPAKMPQKSGPRINEAIEADTVLLIDENGEKQGEMPLSAALEAAQAVNLDLVEVSPERNDARLQDP